MYERKEGWLRIMQFSFSLFPSISLLVNGDKWKSNDVRRRLAEHASSDNRVPFDEGAKLDVPIVADGVIDSSNGNFCKYCRSMTITRSTAGFIVTFVFSNTASRYLVQFHWKQHNYSCIKSEIYTLAPVPRHPRLSLGRYILMRELKQSSANENREWANLLYENYNRLFEH